MLGTRVKEESANKPTGTDKLTDKVKSLELMIATLEGELKTMLIEKEKTKTENVNLLLDKGGLERENNDLKKELETTKVKYQADLDYWKSNYEKLAGDFKSFETSQEPTERNQSSGKPISMDAFNPVIDIFLEEGPTAAIERVEWLFSLYLVSDAKSRLNYLISCVFKRPSETRNDLLKVANTLSDYLLTEKAVKWSRITEIVSSCDNSAKRKADSWDAFIAERNRGVQADGSNLETYLLKWKKAEIHWSTALTFEERFIALLGGFHGQITVEVLKYRESQSDGPFKDTNQSIWFSWIRKAVNTLRDARLIQQFRDEVSIEPFNNFKNNNFNIYNQSQHQQHHHQYHQQQQHHHQYHQQQQHQQQHQHQQQQQQHQQQQQQQQQQHQHQQQHQRAYKQYGCFRCSSANHKIADCPEKPNRF
ncbi:hypothetical protein ACTFIZ_006448 [Dictyostelium cf. discoideum]